MGWGGGGGGWGGGGVAQISSEREFQTVGA